MASRANSHGWIVLLPWVWIAVSSLATASPPKIRDKSLCPGVILRGAEIPDLSPIETRLICGDPGSEAWKIIPRNQAEFNLRNFLQGRGYFHPVFERVPGTATAALVTTIVHLGVPTRASRMVAVGAPVDLHLERKRGVIGEVMTPDLLDSAEKWVGQRLQALGYPCPKVKGEGDPDTGEIRLLITTGPRQNLVSIIEGPVPGIEPTVLRRYDAFRLGGPFNGDRLNLTGDRLVKLGLFDSAYFAPSCGPNGATARQEVIEGPPRLLQFGVGIDTEGLIQARAAWTNARLGRRADSLKVSLQASTKIQELVTQGDAYALGGPSSRQSVHPMIDFLHENQQFYEISDLKTQIAHQTSWDGENLGAKSRLGPTLEFARTYRLGASPQDLQGLPPGFPIGAGPRNTHFLTLDGQVDLISHDFELNRLNPQTGYDLTLYATSASKAIYSSVTVQRLYLRGEALWNYRQYDPPLAVFGLRGGIGTTVSPERPSPTTVLPPTYLYFLGGSTDLRGWGLQELSAGGSGGMTAFFTDLEIRWVNLFPFGLQPFVFTDVGALGVVPFAFQPPVYWSPGVGLRLGTQIGVFRTTLAHGFPMDAPGHFQFYFSFGEEF